MFLDLKADEGKQYTSTPRAILVFGVAFSAAGALFVGMHPFFNFWDGAIDGFLRSSGIQLLPSMHFPESQFFIWRIATTVLFATVGAAIGYNMHSNLSSLRIATIQVLVVSIICMVVLPMVHPVEPWLALLFGELVGWSAIEQKLSVAKQKQLGVEAKLRQRQLEESQILLVKSDETDKRIFAADLHDRVLNDIKMALNEFNEYKKTPDDAKARKISKLLNETMIDMRSLMDELNPVMLECFGLVAALEDCANTYGERAGFSITFVNTAPADLITRLNQVEQQLIYRLIQESLTNITKHAEAKNVVIKMSNAGDELRIEVADDGKGMSGDADESSRGLKYMRMRAALIGANVAWTAGTHGKGTAVHINVPVRS